jgi:hypothetical protein
VIIPDVPDEVKKLKAGKSTPAFKEGRLESVALSLPKLI